MQRLLIGAVCAAMMAPAAYAQGSADRSVCGVRADVVEKLSGKFGELQQGAGLVNKNRVLELWHSAKTGSWTILMTRADGKTCIMAAGLHWKDQELVPGDPT
jgi:hypothetical protein